MKRITVLLLLIALFAFFGFSDATYLTLTHFLGEAPSCSLIEGCEEVTTSRFATVGGIPISLFGAFYYLTLFFGAVLLFDTRRFSLASVLAVISGMGFFVSLVLVYIQLFVLDAICLYCMTSAVISTLLFIFSTLLVLQWKHINK